MTDIVDSKTRSRMMAGIRSRNTKPEITVRRMLHRDGFRFRLHVSTLPGTPDIVLPRFHAAVFIHGCFWHGHDCPLFRMPATRTGFWQEKIDRNRQNDLKSVMKLQELGWRVAVIWECALRGAKKDPELVLNQLEKWLQGTEALLEVRG